MSAPRHEAFGLLTLVVCGADLSSHLVAFLALLFDPYCGAGPVLK